MAKEFFDQIGDALVNAGEDVSQKAKEVSNKARTQYEIRKKERVLRKRYEQIGRKYYEKNKDEDESLSDVTDLLQEIDELKAQTSGPDGKTCPVCGQKVTEESLFCNHCGAELGEPLFEDETDMDEEQETVDEDE